MLVVRAFDDLVFAFHDVAIARLLQLAREPPEPRDDDEREDRAHDERHGEEEESDHDDRDAADRVEHALEPVALPRRESQKKWIPAVLHSYALQFTVHPSTPLCSAQGERRKLLLRSRRTKKTFAPLKASGLNEPNIYRSH